MQVSSSAFSQIQQLVNNNEYAAAYGVALNDLKASNPNPSASDADVLTWLNIAQQVNSGATTFNAVAIRANNQAAVQYELGKSIDLFGPEEQASSDAVAKGFLTYILNNNGSVQNFQQVIASDALNGLSSLGVSLAAWAGALPSLVTQSFTGFTTDNYYSTLAPGQQTEADLLHAMAVTSIAGYYSSTSLGYSPTSSFSDWVTTTIIKADVGVANAYINGANAVATELQQGVVSVQATRWVP